MFDVKVPQDDVKLQAAYSRFLNLQTLFSAVHHLVDKAMLCTADVEVDWFRDAVLREHGLTQGFQTYCQLRDQMRAVRVAQRMKVATTNQTIDENNAGDAQKHANLDFCLGITPTEMLDIIAPRLASDQMNNKKLISEIEECVAARVETIAEIFGCKGSTKENLLRSVQSTLQHHKDMHAKVLQLWKACTAKSLKYLLTITESMQLVIKLLNEHKYENQKVRDETECEWLVKHSQMVTMKAQVLHAKLLADTYTADTLPTLRLISQELNTLTNDTESVFSQVSARLSQYSQAGPEMDGIARKYQTLLEEVQHAEYSLTECKALHQDM